MATVYRSGKIIFEHILNTLFTYKTQPDYHSHIVACWLGQKRNLTWKW